MKQSRAVRITSAVLLGVLSTAGPSTTAVLALSAEPARVAVASASPVLDVPAPFFWDHEHNRRAGARAARFELDDPELASDMSAWYHLAYVVGGDRLQVFEHNPPTTMSATSTIAKAQNVAWHVAKSVLDGSGGVAKVGELPDWARPRTDNASGTSGGLLYALAYLDLLSSGRLAAYLHVAATGAIGSDGVITAVRLVDAKLAAARLADADVFFAPSLPANTAQTTTVASHNGHPTAERSIGDWLNTAGYEAAGRIAASHPDALALVTVRDIRQALAWLCGRTQQAETCDFAHASAATTVSTARPYLPTASTEPSHTTFWA
jgi:hypothetical protein